jgi:hypothetical protein
VSDSTKASRPHEGVRDALADGEVAPLLGRGLHDLAGAAVGLGQLEEPLGRSERVGGAMEHHVLDRVAELGVDLVVHDQGASVDDAHVEAGLDRVEQEHRVDRLAHRVVAPEGERDVGDAARDLGAREVLLDPARALDEVDAVRRVLLDARADSEDVGVEDDVLGREADLVDQDPVGALADLLSALEVVGLAVLVEGHDDHGRAVLAAEAGLLAELVLALLHGDRVDDRLALDALQAGLDDLELRGVDHHRDAADVGLGRDQLQEAVHRGDAVDHALVHVDVDDLRAALDLLRGDLEGGVVVAVLDQLAEASRAGDVGALADVDEEGLLDDVQRLEAGQAHGRTGLGRRAGLEALGRPRDGTDVLGRGAAAATEDVDQAGVGELADDRGHLVGGLVVLAEGVGQPGVGVAGDEAVGEPAQLGDVLTHLGGTERAVEADRQRLDVADGVPERLRGLAGQRAARRVRDRAGHDDRPAAAPLLEERLDREDRGLGVEGVEDGLDQQDVGSAVDEALGLLEVRRDQLVVGHVAGTRVVDVRGDARGAVRRTERARDVPGPLGRAELVAGLAGQPCTLEVHLVGERLHAEVGLRDRGRAEGVGLDHVRTGSEVLLVDVADHVGLGQHEHVAVALDVARPVGEALAAVLGLTRGVALDHGAHGTVDHQDALAKGGAELFGAVWLDLLRHDKPSCPEGVLDSSPSVAEVPDAGSSVATPLGIAQSRGFMAPAWLGWSCARDRRCP